MVNNKRLINKFIEYMTGVEIALFLLKLDPFISPAYAQDFLEARKAPYIQTLDNHGLNKNLEEVRIIYTSLDSLIQEYNINFIETKDTPNVLKMRATGQTYINYNPDTNNIDSCFATIYTGSDTLEFYINGERKIVNKRTDPIIKADIIHEILEVDEVQRQLKQNDSVDVELSHLIARRKQLDYNIGLRIEEYLHIYANYLENGGLDFPIYLPVDSANVVDVKNINWERLTEPIPINSLRETHQYISVPFIQNGIQRELKMVW